MGISLLLSLHGLGVEADRFRIWKQNKPSLCESKFKVCTEDICCVILLQKFGPETIIFVSHLLDLFIFDLNVKVSSHAHHAHLPTVPAAIHHGW